MAMKEVNVLSLEMLSLECEKLELFHWFAQMLSKHVTDAGRVDGCSVPLFILKTLAYSQEKYAGNVSPDTGLLIEGIADAACIVASNEDLNRKDLHNVTSKRMKTFKEDAMNVLRQLSDQLLTTIAKHGDVIRELQKQQQTCWILEKKVGKRSADLNKFQTKHADRYDASTNTMTGKYGRQLKALSENFWKVQDEHTENLLIFEDIKMEETDARQEMLEIAANIQEIVTDVLAKKTKESVQCLMTAIQTKMQPGLSTKKLMQKLQSVDVRRMADSVYTSCSKFYVYPIVENYNVNMDFVPDVSLKEKNLRRDWPKTISKEKRTPGDLGTLNVLLDRTEGYDDRSCYYENFNGCYMKVSQNSTRHFNLKGFFDNKKDWKIKQKMLLLDGNIGFGWTRKSILEPKKIWGLFAMPSLEPQLMKLQ